MLQTAPIKRCNNLHTIKTQWEQNASTCVHASLRWEQCPMQIRSSRSLGIALVAMGGGGTCAASIHAAIILALESELQLLRSAGVQIRRVVAMARSGSATCCCGCSQRSAAAPWGGARPPAHPITVKMGALSTCFRPALLSISTQPTAIEREHSKRVSECLYLLQLSHPNSTQQHNRRDEAQSTPSNV